MKKRRIQVGKYYRPVWDSRWIKPVKESIYKVLEINGENCKVFILIEDTRCIITCEMHISYVGKEVTKKTVEELKAKTLTKVIADYKQEYDKF